MYCLLDTVFGMMIIFGVTIFAVIGSREFVENYFFEVNVFIIYLTVCITMELISVIAIFEYVFEIFSHDSDAICANEVSTFSLDKSVHLVGGIVSFVFPLLLFSGYFRRWSRTHTGSTTPNADEDGIALAT